MPTHHGIKAGHKIMVISICLLSIFFQHKVYHDVFAPHSHPDSQHGSWCCTVRAQLVQWCGKMWTCFEILLTVARWSFCCLVGKFPRQMDIKSIQSVVVYLSDTGTAVVGLDITYELIDGPVFVTHGIQTGVRNPVELMSAGTCDRTGYTTITDSELFTGFTLTGVYGQLGENDSIGSIAFVRFNQNDGRVDLQGLYLHRTWVEPQLKISLLRRAIWHSGSDQILWDFWKDRCVCRNRKCYC